MTQLDKINNPLAVIYTPSQFFVGAIGHWKCFTSFDSRLHGIREGVFRLFLIERQCLSSGVSPTLVEILLRYFPEKFYIDISSVINFISRDSTISTNENPFSDRYCFVRFICSFLRFFSHNDLLSASELDMIRNLYLIRSYTCKQWTTDVIGNPKHLVKIFAPTKNKRKK